jgi:hypothetical protein
MTVPLRAALYLRVSTARQAKSRLRPAFAVLFEQPET